MPPKIDYQPETHLCRLKLYSKLAINIASLSNEEILSRITNAPKINTGIGGTSVLLEIDGSRIFTKLVPLTELEAAIENRDLTKNIFNLPLYYQYGVGSTGFGAYRELASHKMCSKWVLEDKSEIFPLLYHSRILPAPEEYIDVCGFQSLEEHARYWEDNPAIKNRYQQIINAKQTIVLFLEYIPFHLSKWIKMQVEKEQNFIDKEGPTLLNYLKEASQFMARNGMVHFDSHFKNVLTDGKQVYFADHGLVLSDKFDLTKEEQQFLAQHRYFDESFIIVNLLHTFITALLGENSWENTILKLSKRAMIGERLPSFLLELINDYGDMIVEIDKFYKNMQKQSKSTLFPFKAVEDALSRKSY